MTLSASIVFHVRLSTQRRSTDSTANKMLAEVESSTSDYFSPSDSWGDLVDQLIDVCAQLVDGVEWLTVRVISAS